MLDEPSVVCWGYVGYEIVGKLSIVMNLYEQVMGYIDNFHATNMMQMLIYWKEHKKK